MSNFNSFYQDLYRILWIIPKILRTSAFPQPPPPPPPHPPPHPQTSAFETPLPPLRTSFMDGPLEASALLQRTYTAELNDKQLPTPRLHCLFVLICYKRITISEKCCPPVDIDCCQLYLATRAFWRNPGNLQQEKSYCC